MRVLNPTHEPIDGISLDQTARRCKVIPFGAGGDLQPRRHHRARSSCSATPEVRVDDLFVVGHARRQTRASCTSRPSCATPAAQAKQGIVEFTLASARSGETTAALHLARRVRRPAARPIEADLTIDNPHLWDLNDPYLYRVTARVRRRRVRLRSTSNRRAAASAISASPTATSASTAGASTCAAATPATITRSACSFPQDPDLLRRDLLNMKVMGFNAIRFIWGGATPVQLDLCDEIGLLVYEESYASMPIGRLAARWPSGSTPPWAS